MSKPKFLGMVAIWAGAHLARGWPLMLAAGIAHHDWTPAIPPLGFWWAVLIAALLQMATSRLPDSFWSDEPRRLRTPS
jgi:hypothetical protein